jgi:hypothetical protein
MLDKYNTMPGNRPPSAMPNSALTAAKLPNERTNPKHMVMIPHATVNEGSQIRGDTFFRTRLLGSSL